MLETLKEWQELVGSFVGVSVPLFFALFAYSWRQRRLRKERIYYIDKAITTTANAGLLTKVNIISFLERLQGLIDAEKGDGRSAINLIFFPLINTHPLDRTVFDVETGSGYLDSMIIQSYSHSTDFAASVEDTRNQLNITLELNNNLALSDKLSPNEQANHYKRHLIAYKDSVEKYFLQKNIPIYLRHIMHTKVALNHYQDIGRLRWKLRFGLAHKFFWTKEAYLKAKKENFKKIKDFFSEDVEKEIARGEQAMGRKKTSETDDAIQIVTPTAFIRARKPTNSTELSKR